MDTAQDYRRRAEECEQEAARVTQLAEVRQFRLLAQAWRDLADMREVKAAAEPRSFGQQT
jgi:hypothetical protein